MVPVVSPRASIAGSLGMFMQECLVCMHVYVSHTFLVSVEARGRCWVSWNWSYTHNYKVPRGSFKSNTDPHEE